MPVQSLLRAMAPALGLACALPAAYAEESQTESLSPVSVTATRSEVPVKEVPAAIAVIGEERLETSKQFNISETLREIPGVLIDSQNGGYDAQLIIRGAGLKANYGIREIMLLRDGVPVTDPDSFTRLDFIDTQDIERIEVTKGPGNLYAAGNSGGTVQIISRSVFDHGANNIKIGAGNFNQHNLHGRYSGDITGNQALAGTASYRATDNSWRRNNEFDTSQLSVKHGIFFGSDNVLETELGYSEANLQLPGTMNAEQYQEFVNTGKQTDNDSAFKNMGRYSDNLYLNTRMEVPYRSLLFKPKFYYNQYSQFHPVTGAIVETPHSRIFGLDLEMEYGHKLGGLPGTFTGGATSRRDVNEDSKRYKYADVVTIPTGRIIETLSDTKGDLIETENNYTTLNGFFAMEMLSLTPKTRMDIGTRVDWARISMDGYQSERYDYGRGMYVAGVGDYNLARDFTLTSPRIGVTHAVTRDTNVFVTLAQADQIPFANELYKNPDLNPSTTQNLEVGVKKASRFWSLDSSIYYMQVQDEIIPIFVDGETLFQNAGKTSKKGFELATTYRPARPLSLGLNYAYTDYRYVEFTEEIRGVPVDRSGNQLPFVPRHKYTLFADWKDDSGFQFRISTDTWGRYYVDNANSETWEGYQFVTNMFFGYERKRHRVGFNVSNLTDQRYAQQVKKDYRLHFVAGAPRNFLLSYEYKL